jgi:NADPH2:quinone reductase
MFARSLYQTADMAEQGALHDAGRLRSKLGEHLRIINAVNLRRAHALPESGRGHGEIVLEGF